MIEFDKVLRQWMFDNADLLVYYDYKLFFNQALDTYATLSTQASDVRVPDIEIVEICWDVFKNTHSRVGV